ncbi:hypothetical protein JKP88DRAFT_219218 [Tribonema minus]|uniref:Ubiquitin-like domain-containing protein n=1 Tax=Tribonema minus TaxID=303371 RepID=A0A836CH29_9STRA|nr:hypothetical protein JKP88DRAFT_219218 [Tribonema minus]
MRFSLLLSAGAVLAAVVPSLASAPLNVVVTLRGKKYQVSGSSVSDIQAEVQEKAGLSAEQQSVLFKGKLLAAGDDLSTVGVSDGDTINVVPSKKPKAERTAAAGVDADGTVDAPGGEGSGFPGIAGFPGMGSMPGMPAGMPDLSPEEYQKMMGEVLNSPMMDEFFGSPEKIEESRKAILENPMLKQAMAQLPGFSEMLEDPDKWMESMLQAKEMLEQQRSMLQDQGGAPLGGDVDDLDDE